MSSKRKSFPSTPTSQRSISSFFSSVSKGSNAKYPEITRDEPTSSQKKLRQSEDTDSTIFRKTPISKPKNLKELNDVDQNDEPMIPCNLNFNSDIFNSPRNGNSPKGSNFVNASDPSDSISLHSSLIENIESEKPIDQSMNDNDEDTGISIKRGRRSHAKRRVLSIEDSDEEFTEATTQVKTKPIQNENDLPANNIPSQDEISKEMSTHSNGEECSVILKSSERNFNKNSSVLSHKIERSKKMSTSSPKASENFVSRNVVEKSDKQFSIFGNNKNFSKENESTYPNSPSNTLENGFGIQLSGVAEERFSTRFAEKFSFLNGCRKDAQGRKMSDADFDKNTVFLPEKFLKSLSEGQRQWWQFKSNNLDKVLLFKMGKFYEMYEMDAHVGVQELDLQYMRGDQPHCGFPEKNYATYASKLALKGYRVLVIEQTETPEQLEQRKRETGCKDKVVKREACSLITKGTLVDDDMVDNDYAFSYILSIYEYFPTFSEMNEFRKQKLDEEGTREKEDSGNDNGLDENNNNNNNTNFNDIDENVMIGVCLVDVSSSTVFLDQFVDDSSRKKLKNILTEYSPVEILKNEKNLSKQTEKALRENTKNPLTTSLALKHHHFDSKIISNDIFSYFNHFTNQRNTNMNGKNEKLSNSHVRNDDYDDDGGDDDGDNDVNVNDDGDEMNHVFDAKKVWTHVLNFLQNVDIFAKFCLFSLRLVLSYLKSAFLDERFLFSAKIKFLPSSYMYTILKRNAMEKERMNEKMIENDGVNEDEDEGMNGMFSEKDKIETGGKTKPVFEFEESHAFEEYMHLDSSAIENLEILENSKNGGLEGTLFSHLDYCVTNFGKRKLKQWIIHPLLNIESITKRQKAMSDLRGIGRTGLFESRKLLSTCPDLEKLLTRLQSNSSRMKLAVLYEDFTLKKVKEFVSGLNGIVTIKKAIECFDKTKNDFSEYLKNLLTPGKRFPPFICEIKYFENAFDWMEAERTGRIIPIKGKNKKYDTLDQKVLNIETELEKYLQKQRKIFGNSAEVHYVNVGKDNYLLEIPDHFHSKVPAYYEVRSQKKGYYRYWTEEIKEMLSRLTESNEARENYLNNILEDLKNEFCSHMRIWNKLVDAISELDALSSLAIAGDHCETATCQPKFRSPFVKSGNATSAQNHDPDSPFIVARNLKHPILMQHDPTLSFVPNDLSLGNGKNNFAILTGPNMGGKSTLLRQICLAVIMAQIGADVHADGFELSVVDKIFVRMGAKDNIISNQSTFFTELSETSNMLRLATKNSLVLLDELGRGTSTADGQAIAHAVLEHLAHEKKCLGIFSTHYHKLAEEFDSDPMVCNFHMACKVEKDKNGNENVFFLYKLREGICPKSYGLNVARIAGVPHSVLEIANKKAMELERTKNEKREQQGNVIEKTMDDLSLKMIGIRERDALKSVFELFEKKQEDFAGASCRTEDLLEDGKDEDVDCEIKSQRSSSDIAYDRLYSDLLACWKNLNDSSF